MGKPSKLVKIIGITLEFPTRPKLLGLELGLRLGLGLEIYSLLQIRGVCNLFALI